MAAGIILVHGYTGSPDDLGPLAGELAATAGAGGVTSVLLPGHGGGAAPPFDRDAFVRAIAAAAAVFHSQGRDIIIVGHSTGGILALDTIAEYALSPRLLVLAAVPNRIDGSYLERWSRHSAGTSGISFSSVARMVSLINATGSRSHGGHWPVLVLHGEGDELVPAREAFAWRDRFTGPVRTVIVPGAGHHLFRGGNDGFALDVALRAAADALHELTGEQEATIARLLEAEPGVARFLALSPHSARHLADSPSGRLLRDAQPLLGTTAAGEPVFANIEITTRCNLRCAFCARTGGNREEQEMSTELFCRLLDLLPHAYRITLVGLGEPLLHPEVAGFVAAASARGRRVALATNAMHLTEEVSRSLLAAGLDAIVFSLDTADPGLAAEVRGGTLLDRAIANMKAFGEMAATRRPVARAVFAAVSVTTAPHLEQLVETVAGLGVDVLMLSDLNFRQNLPKSLWQNADERVSAAIHRAVRRAFALKLPVLSVRGLEEFALAGRYHKHLLVPPGMLYRRSAQRSHCFSPWQTIPVAVDGTVTICDCQPEDALGSILDRPFAALWNGAAMTAHRRRMLGQQAPDPCAICPRF